MTGMTTGNFRFKDIGGQAYSQTYAASYSYANARVTISLDTPGLYYLAGAIVATGLKPNFAYEVKVVGNPSKGATTADQLAIADDVSNETIGHAGRWWRVRPNPANSTDADYATNKDNPDYVFEGYLDFAFFVTDAQGNANVRFVGNNSFHVLWRTDQRQRGPNDGPAQSFALPDTTGNPAYETTVPARSFDVYGEWEPTRALPGALQMPAQHYRGRLFLTEESFHDTGVNAGQWASAMFAPVEFDIPTTLTPWTTQDGSALPLTVTSLRAMLNLSHGHRDSLSVTGSLNLPAGFTFNSTEVTADVLGVAHTFVPNRAGHARFKGGSLSLRSLRKGNQTTRFVLRLNRQAFTVDSGALQAAVVEVPVRLLLFGDSYEGSAKTEQKIGNAWRKLRYRGQ